MQSIHCGYRSCLKVMLGLLLTGCSAAEQSEPSPGAVDQPIIGGTQPPAGTAEGQGWVMVNRAGGTCSGTLMRNDMVLTARHCTTTDANNFGPVDNNMANYTVTMGPQSRGVTEVLRHTSVVSHLGPRKFHGDGLASREASTSCADCTPARTLRWAERKLALLRVRKQRHHAM